MSGRASFDNAFAVRAGNGKGIDTRKSEAVNTWTSELCRAVLAVEASSATLDLELDIDTLEAGAERADFACELVRDRAEGVLEHGELLSTSGSSPSESTLSGSRC